MTFHIGLGKKELRAARWSDIKSRVTTHEGELLTGKKARDYAQKYSKKYLGRDLSARGFRVDPRVVERFERTGR